MKNTKIKSIILLLVITMVASSLSGCTLMNGFSVGKVNGDRISYGVANFYARHKQQSYQTYYDTYGYKLNDAWDTKQDGKTLEQTVKKEIKDDLVEMYILEDHMADYDVKLTKKEKKEVKKAAKRFIKENPSRDIKLISGQTKYVERILTLMTIKDKVKAVIQQKADTNVSDEEANQKKMYYAEFKYEEKKDDDSDDKDSDDAKEEDTSSEDSSSESSDDEKLTDKTYSSKEEALKVAQDYINKMKEKKPSNDDFTSTSDELKVSATEELFNKDDDNPSKDAIKAADKLKAGEYTTVEGDEAVYAIYLMSEHDEEGTKTKKDEIIKDRKDKKYEKEYKKLKKKSKYSFNIFFKAIDLRGITLETPSSSDDETTSESSEPSTDTTTDETDDAATPTDETDSTDSTEPADTTESDTSADSAS